MEALNKTRIVSPMAILHLLSIMILLSPTTTSSSSRSINELDDVFTEYSHPRRQLFAMTSKVSRHFTHPVWFGASISFSIGFTLGILIFFLWRITVKHYIKPDPDQEPSRNPTLFSPVINSTEDLTFLQGEVLPPLEIIGRGGCGEVYKAELSIDGQTVQVAIKKILHPKLIDARHLIDEESKLLGHQMRQIRSEIMTVGRMRHPNLLRLHAHVPKPECHYLVYEYMKNGSLHDALKRKTPLLDWPARFNIALGITIGLEYLHTLHRPRIIHRDLKPANILLDDNLNAKISDFGLAKIVHDTNSGPISSKNVAGTLGYIAPEYYQTLVCTAKSDIFSFGMILAVLVTGMFPNDGFFQTTDEMCMVGWLGNVVNSDDPSEAIDRTLIGTGFEEEMLLVLRIACFCTYDIPRKRPSITDVRSMLWQIKH